MPTTWHLSLPGSPQWNLPHLHQIIWLTNHLLTCSLKNLMLSNWNDLEITSNHDPKAEPLTQAEREVLKEKIDLYSVHIIAWALTVKLLIFYECKYEIVKLLCSIRTTSFTLKLLGSGVSEGAGLQGGSLFGCTPISIRCSHVVSFPPNTISNWLFWSRALRLRKPCTGGQAPEPTFELRLKCMLDLWPHSKMLCDINNTLAIL